MRKEYTKLMVTLLISTMCLSLLIPIAQAGEALRVALQVTVTLTGAPQQGNEDYEIIIKADDPTYPMPKGSENGIYKLIITGENTVTLPTFQFPSLGVYTYKISQVPGSNDLGNYDDSIYQITVYITNAEDGSGLKSTVIAQKDNENTKIDEIEFRNDYEVDIPDEEPPAGPADPTAKSTDPPLVPITGDTTIIWPYIALFAGTGVLFLILVLARKRTKARE